MGDCRIRFLEPSEDTSTSLSATEVCATLWSSDTTVYDCFRHVKTKLGGKRGPSLWLSMEDHVVSIWDCTKYPPANVTEICLTSGKDLTLYAAGWFPSGTLQILPPNVDGIIFASADSHQDLQYNYERTSLNPKESVKLIGKTFVANNSTTSGKLMASQVLDAIPKRFDNDKADPEMTDAVRIRQQNKVNRREVEIERARKLDQRIQRLHNRQASKISNQVRRMLIKSRAAGRKDLREEDRVYLHVCFHGGDDDNDDEPTEDYRFFSLQDTIGAALGSFQTQSKSTNCEMLVSLDGLFFRLPSGLRFFEALDRKALAADVTTVVVRFFNEGESTTSIDERAIQDQLHGDSPNADMSFAESIPQANSGVLRPDTAVVEFKLDDDAMASLLGWLREKYPKPKNQNPTLLKVQQMKMKGKAKGDPKRIKSVDDRFFFEFVIASSENNWQPISRGPVYYALTDPMNRCCVDIPSGRKDWKVCVFEEEQLKPIASSTQSSKTWKSLLQAGDIAQFSIVVWFS